jgi:ribosomal 30S subunit maturation factor RimM
MSILVKIGTIICLHGIRDKVKIRVFISHEKMQQLLIDGKTYLPSGKCLLVDNIGFYKNDAIVSIVGASRDGLIGQDVFASRAEFGEELLVMDLVGCVVKLRNGNTYGTVVDMPDYGAGSLIEIAITGKKSTELYLFNDSFFTDIDLAQRTLILHKPQTELVIEEE